MLRMTVPILCWVWTAGMTVAQGGRQDVLITSADGFELAADYTSAGRPGPGVLLLHQCNRESDMTGFEGLAPLLAAAGLHVLALDSRGFGESRDERYRSYREQMDLIDTKVAQDVEAAYRFLVAREGVQGSRMGVVGASCGTWQAIGLAATHPEIRALVFLSGSYLGLETAESAYRTLVDRPVLTIYSEGDRYGTPASMRDAFTRSRHEASKMIVYKGDLHGTPLFGRDRGLEREIVAWLRTPLFGG